MTNIYMLIAMKIAWKAGNVSSCIYIFLSFKELNEKWRGVLKY